MGNFPFRTDRLRKYVGLMLVGINENIHEKLTNTGFAQAIGEKNIYPVTVQFGQALNQALQNARIWLEATSPS